ncbi:MAG: ribosome recycling factor [Candidatus Peregrinibacteria bacterium]
MSQQVLMDAFAKFQQTLDHLHAEYSKIQTGRANAALVEGVLVESYGTRMPLKALANISIPEFHQIVIQPWDRSQIQAVEKAIRDSNLGLNPQNDGILIRLNLPPLTEERRRELVKLVNRTAEEARIAIRNARHEAMSQLKVMELSEDEKKSKEEVIQKKVDEFNKKIEEAAKKKEQDVMTV